MTSTELKTAVSGRKVYDMQMTVTVSDEYRKCPICGDKMHVNNHPLITLKPLNFGETLSQVSFEHYQLRCIKCGKTKSQYISWFR